jgi:hypothetical protein
MAGAITNKDKYQIPIDSRTIDCYNCNISIKCSYNTIIQSIRG